MGVLWGLGGRLGSGLIRYASLVARGSGVLSRRLAIRVCQPGPVAFQRAMTSGGKRRLIICFGLTDLGLPAFLKTVRANISSVISGKSSYSSGLMTCASTRRRSERKVRCEAGLLTIVGLSHAEDMTHCATRGVPDDHQAALEDSETDDPCLSIVLPLVFDLGSQPIEDQCGILEVKSTMGQCPLALGGIVGDAHGINVYTKIALGKRVRLRGRTSGSAAGEGEKACPILRRQAQRLRFKVFDGNGHA